MLHSSRRFVYLNCGSFVLWLSLFLRFRQFNFLESLRERLCVFLPKLFVLFPYDCLTNLVVENLFLNVILKINFTAKCVHIVTFIFGRFSQLANAIFDKGAEVFLVEDKLSAVISVVGVETTHQQL